MSQHLKNNSEPSSTDIDAAVAELTKAKAFLTKGQATIHVINQGEKLIAPLMQNAASKLPTHPNTTYQVVPGGHKVAPDKGKTEIAAWLLGL